MLQLAFLLLALPLGFLISFSLPSLGIHYVSLLSLVVSFEFDYLAYAAYKPLHPVR